MAYKLDLRIKLKKFYILRENIQNCDTSYQSF